MNYSYLGFLGTTAFVSLRGIKNRDFDGRQKHFCGFALDF